MNMFFVDRKESRELSSNDTFFRAGAKFIKCDPNVNCMLK